MLSRPFRTLCPHFLAPRGRKPSCRLLDVVNQDLRVERANPRSAVLDGETPWGVMEYQGFAPSRTVDLGRGVGQGGTALFVPPHSFAPGAVILVGCDGV